jgi:5-methylcytosine-specific restriction endonuclease McrA
MDYFITDIPPEVLRREKEKARELRASRWWKSRVAAGRCHWCGGAFPPGELTMDHIVPIVRGGTSSRGNVVPACKECNNRKKYLLPVEWEEYLLRLQSRDGEASREGGQDEG